MCSFLSDGKKRKKNHFIFTANHYNIVLSAPLQIWLTNCKTQPCCSDKLQNSALLLRQTAKLSPVAQTNCKTQPGCSDKLQNSARLLRQTAKLSPVAQTNCKTQPGCMGDVNAVSCHPALCRPRASTFQNKSFTELLLFKVKAQVWNKILFVKKKSLYNINADYHANE